MRGIASLADCRELYRMSGWSDTTFSWYCDEAHDDEPALNLSEPLKVVGGVGYYDTKYPAYDLGYLAAMLPTFELVRRPDESCWVRWHGHENGVTYLEVDSRTSPANALCRLAVKLFEAGVLLADARKE